MLALPSTSSNRGGQLNKFSQSMPRQQQHKSVDPYARKNNKQPSNNHDFSRRAGDIIAPTGLGVVQSFDRMASQMLGQMGIQRMASSPFSSQIANFGSAFSKMDKMFEQSHKQMDRMFKEAFSGHSKMMQLASGGGRQVMQNLSPGGHYYNKVFVSNSSMGLDGQQKHQRYEQSAMAARAKDGNKISQRQQLYQNTDTGLSKASHQRMMNGQGRKIIKQKLDQHQNMYDRFKNLRQCNYLQINLALEDAHLFDRQWHRISDSIGFNSGSQNSVMPMSGQSQPNYGGGGDYNQQHYHHNPHRKQQQQQSHAARVTQGAYHDNIRRGDFVPQNYRDDARAVPYQQHRHVLPPARDIGPTEPAARITPLQAAVQARQAGRQGGGVAAAAAPARRATNVGGGGGGNIRIKQAKQPARAG